MCISAWTSCCTELSLQHLSASGALDAVLGYLTPTPDMYITHIHIVADILCVALSRGNGGALMRNVAAAVGGLKPVYLAALRKWRVEPDALSHCLAIASITSAIGEHETVYIAGGSAEALLVVELHLLCTGHPHIGISEMALEFWHALQVRSLALPSSCAEGR
jgi:hypothetical protein